MAAEPILDVNHARDVPVTIPSLDEDEEEEEEEITSLELDDDTEILPDAHNTQSSSNPPKRKGGRKPIYATVEERKQRNRQAQAAFRERRTEYIKQLENTLKQHEELLHVAQRERQVTAYQSASMQSRITTLERILHEHGIDVESELRARGEQSLVPQEAPATSSLLDSPSGPGVRRPMKHNGSVGNTKLDLLKAKAATARDSMMSPVNSPQSQTSLWNDHSSPHSTVMTSPMPAQPEANGQSLYPVTQSPLSANSEYAQHHPGLPVSHANQMGIPHVFNTQDGPLHTHQPHSSIDASMNLHAAHNMRSRFSGEWGPFPGVTSGKLSPPAMPYTMGLCRPRVDSFVDPGSAPKIPPDAREYASSPAGVPTRLASGTSASIQGQDGRYRQASYLTMPEGFSQEIFPLSYTSGPLPFPAQPIAPTKK